MKQSMMDVFIVNYNSTPQLHRCLESFAGETAQGRIRVTVHDNSSGDGIGFVESRFPEVNIRSNGRNLGFAAAANKALAESNASYVMLLNPDAIVLGDFF